MNFGSLIYAEYSTSPVVKSQPVPTNRDTHKLDFIKCGQYDKNTARFFLLCQGNLHEDKTG